MILEWADFDTWHRRRDDKKEANYQATMARHMRPAGGDRVAWLTYFAWWPVRISKTQKIWLDWFEATPIGMGHGRMALKSTGFAPIRDRASWHYRTKPLSLWRHAFKKIWESLPW